MTLDFLFAGIFIPYVNICDAINRAWEMNLKVVLDTDDIDQ